jgi:DNA-binding MarR family transcriptional regulator
MPTTNAVKQTASLKKQKKREAGVTSELQSWLSVVRTYHLCSEALIDGLKPLGLKLPQHEVLVTLLYAPGQTQQQLATHSFVAKSHISGLLTEMVKLRWVQRIESREDKRVKHIFLTASGKRLAQHAFAVQQSVIKVMFSSLTQRQIADTAKVMRTVGQALLALRGDVINE